MCKMVHQGVEFEPSISLLNTLSQLERQIAQRKEFIENYQEILERYFADTKGLIDSIRDNQDKLDESVTTLSSHESVLQEDLTK